MEASGGDCCWRGGSVGDGSLETKLAPMKSSKLCSNNKRDMLCCHELRGMHRRSCAVHPSVVLPIKTQIVLAYLKKHEWFDKKMGDRGKPQKSTCVAGMERRTCTPTPGGANSTMGRRRRPLAVAALPTSPSLPLARDNLGSWLCLAPISPRLQVAACPCTYPLWGRNPDGHRGTSDWDCSFAALGAAYWTYFTQY
jgi:hypothetical protein